MTPQEILIGTYMTSNIVLNSYIADLSDDDLKHTPGEGCNPLVWQLGHLISSEAMLLGAVCPDNVATLPAGFSDRYKKENANNTSPDAFDTKEELVRLMKANEAAALAAFAATPTEKMNEPGPEFLQPMFATVGATLILVATHSLMHCGQFVPVRRALGKPIVI